MAELSGNSAAGDFAVLYGAADLPELVAVANLLEPGLAAWLLLHPTGGRQAVMMNRRGQELIDPIAASQISKISVPGESEPATPEEPWAKAVLGLLGYQFKVEDTDLMTPIWSSGSLLAVSGITGIGLTAKSLSQGMVLAVRKLNEVESLRRDIDGYRFILEKVDKSIVLALTTGRILCGTAGGLAVLKDLHGRATHDAHAEILPAALRGPIEAGEKQIILNNLRANISHPPILPAYTTAEPVVAVNFSRKGAGRTTPSGLANLTAAERRVYYLLIRGDRNKEIAHKLAISPHTARHHVSSILAKTRYSDRVLLIAAAAQPEPKATPKPQPGKLPVVSLPPAKKLIVGKHELTEDTA